MGDLDDVLARVQSGEQGLEEEFLDALLARIRIRRRPMVTVYLPGDEPAHPAPVQDAYVRVSER